MGVPFRCGALAVIASLFLLGCEARRPSLSTAPAGGSEVVVSGDTLPADVMSSDDAPSTEGLSTTLGGPLAGLDPAELARFTAGRDEFQDQETVENGLGPVFNEASCVTCHDSPVGGTTGRTETRFGRGTLMGFDPLARLGGSLLQDHAIGGVTIGDRKFVFVPEVVPPEANVKALRLTTPLFGLGLVEAVTDAALLALARQQARYAPAIRGTPNMVQEIPTGAIRVGRFGWKAQVPTLHQFSGDAYLNEIGFTSPEFPDENLPQGNREVLEFNPAPALNDSGENVEEFADFMTLLGPPPRGPRSYLTELGGQVFRQIGCASCHTPTLITGDSPGAQGIPPVLRFPAAQHGNARRRHRSGPVHGSPDAHGAALGFEGAPGVPPRRAGAHAGGGDSRARRPGELCPQPLREAPSLREERAPRVLEIALTGHEGDGRHRQDAGQPPAWGGANPPRIRHPRSAPGADAERHQSERPAASSHSGSPCSVRTMRNSGTPANAAAASTQAAETRAAIPSGARRSPRCSSTW